MALISDADLATFLGQASIAGTPQAVMAAQLASGVVTSLLQNGVFTQVTENIFLDGPLTPSSCLTLPGWPVTAVTSVQELTLNADGSSTWFPLTLGVHYLWSQSGFVSKVGVNDATEGSVLWVDTLFADSVSLTPLLLPFWTNLQQGIQVTYTHGFAVVPDAVKAIALALAARYYSNPTGLMMEVIGGYQYRYAPRGNGPLALEDWEQKVLMTYADWHVA